MSEFNLVKNEPFDLSKLEPGMQNIYIGLDWIGDVDLDAVLIATDANGNVVKTENTREAFLFFNNHGRMDGDVKTLPIAFEITEDVTTGGGDDDGDEESIFVYGAEVADYMKELHILVVLHGDASKPNATLEDAKAISVSVSPLVDGTRAPHPDTSKHAVFNILDVGTGLGSLVAKLVRNTSGGWDVVGINEQCGDINQLVVAYGLN